MLCNSDMIAGRFLRLHKARRLFRFIQDSFAGGRSVVVSTMTRATRYDGRHADLFQLRGASVLVRRGKSWDCINHCRVSRD